MRKRAFALILAAALCLTLAAPVTAASGGGAAGLTPEVAGAYADILDQRIQAYGYCGGPDTGSFVDGYDAMMTGVRGVAYARLIDFDKNGTPELYFYYITQDSSGDLYSSLLTDELWYWNGSSAVRALQEEHESNGSHGGYSDDGRAFADFDGRVCLSSSSSYMQHGIMSQYEALSEFKNGAVSEYRSISEEFDESLFMDGSTCYYSLTIDGRKLYDNLSYQYEADPTPNPPEAQDFYRKYTIPDDAWVFHAGPFITLSWRTNDVYDLLGQLQAKATEGMDGTAALNAIPYYGDRSKCKMTAKTALAYAEVLEGMSPRYDGGTTYPHAFLVDVSGGGFPILITLSCRRFDNGEEGGEDFTAWEFDGNRAVGLSFVDEGPAVHQYMSNPQTLSLVQMDGASMLYVSYNRGSLGVEDIYGDFFYRESRGRLERAHTGLQVLREEDYFHYEYLWDGETVDQFPAFTTLTTIYEIAPTSDTFAKHIPAASAAAALQAYARSAPGYSYPLVTEDEDRYVREVAQAVAGAVGGEITGIYKLADGVYYVLITVNGTPKGVLVRGVREGGSLVWKVDTPSDPMEGDALDASLAGLLSRSNVSLDYSKLQGADLPALLTYLQQVLDNVDGLEPNDPGKRDLAEFLRSAISSLCSQAVSGKDNRLTLDRDNTAALVAQARQAHDELTGLLDKRVVPLNQPITIIVRILWQNIDSGAPCQVTLDRDLLDALDGCTLQLLLGDGQHYLLLSTDALRALLDGAGALSIQLSRDGERTYTLNFLDENGELIQRTTAPITVGLPCGSPTSTIMASYQGGSDNWGGQYDENAGVISFDTRYSGQYEVLENNVTISDIGSLPQESQDAIRFLVSKGFMVLDGERFRPGDPLSRYDFAEALVGLFFALDRSLTTTFPDVPADSPFYPYVASGEHEHILNGYGDGTYSGGDSITIEQMLAMGARTLIERKGYTEPEDPARYLTSFSDADQTSDWARDQVAMAIREGLVDLGGPLTPLDDVTREQAAVILYRLFLLLHEVSPAALELPAVTETAEPAGSGEAARGSLSVPVIAAIAAGGAAAVGGGAAALVVVLLNKKKKSTKV